MRFSYVGALPFKDLATRVFPYRPPASSRHCLQHLDRPKNKGTVRTLLPWAVVALPWSINTAVVTQAANGDTLGVPPLRATQRS